MSFQSRIAVAVLAGAALLAGCQKSDVDSEIGAVNQQVMSAIAAGDGAAVAALYTEDAQLLAPNSPALAGRERIAAYWQGAIGAGVKGANLKTLEAQCHGDTAHEVGEYRLTSADGKQIDAGKYIVIWKRVDKQWRLHRDIWNTSGK